MHLQERAARAHARSSHETRKMHNNDTHFAGRHGADISTFYCAPNALNKWAANSSTTSSSSTCCLFVPLFFFLRKIEQIAIGQKLINNRIISFSSCFWTKNVSAAATAACCYYCHYFLFKMRIQALNSFKHTYVWLFPDCSSVSLSVPCENID